MPVDLLIFFKGMGTGFFYSLLMITSMMFVAEYILQQTYKIGVLAALGIMLGQVFWVTIAVFTLYFIFHLFNPNGSIFSLIGAIILFGMTIKIYRSKERYHHEEHLKKSPFVILGSTLLFSLSFPFSMIGYLAIFLVTHIYNDVPTIQESFLTIFGVFMGSVIYWMIFIGAIHYRKNSIPHKTFQKIQRLAIFALIALSILGLLNLYF